MADSPRELVAVALATLGLPLCASAADVDAAGVGAAGLRARVGELRQQARASWALGWAGPCAAGRHGIGPAA